MKFHNDGADCFIPDGVSIDAALARTTHLGVGAHQDDLEIMAFHGIAACFPSGDRWFTGLTCTDGTGGLRAGAYRDASAHALRGVRRSEQRAAAVIGRYGAMVQLDYPSDDLRSGVYQPLVNDLRQLLLAAMPEVLYTHSLADRHATHLAVALHVIRALRELPQAQQPRHVYGCEVWGSLDWLVDNDKVVLDVSGREHLANALIGLYDSQIDSAKRYDRATIGRRRSNAVYLESHGEAQGEQVIFAMDLKPLISNHALDPMSHVGQLFERARDAARERLERQLREGNRGAGRCG